MNKEKFKHLLVLAPFVVVIVIWILLYVFAHVLSIRSLFGYDKQREELFESTYSGIEFEGNILSVHKVMAYKSKPWIVCVELTKSNVEQFYRYDSDEELSLKIENGIASLPFENYEDSYDIQRFTKIQVNNGGNRMVIFSNEDGEELQLPLTYKSDVGKWDLEICF